MILQQTTAYQNKLKRLSHACEASQKLLQSHLSVNPIFSGLQMILHQLNRQIQWKLIGPSSRLLLTLQTAMQGCETNNSQTGFIGPTLVRLQKEMAQLMHVSLSPSEKREASVLAALTQILSIGTVFITPHLIENWNRLFPRHEQKGSSLLRELGITFILGSRTVESTLRSVCKGLELTESGSKRITDIGMFFLLIQLILIDEETDSHEEMTNTIKEFLKPTLGSMEEALIQAQTENLYESGKAMIALNHLQLIKNALDKPEETNLKNVVINGLDSLGFSNQEVQQDLKKLITFCKQLNTSFRNIFYQTGRTATTVIQAA